MRYSCAKAFEGFTGPLIFGRNVQFWQKTIWGWNVVPSWGEAMLIPWHRSATRPGRTTQGRRCNFSMSRYRTVTDFQGFIIKPVFIPTWAARHKHALGQHHDSVCVLIPWKMCLQPREESPPPPLPRKKGSWEGSAGHWSDSSSPVPRLRLLQCWANLTWTTPSVSSQV